jgi:hypothetical protein
MTIVCAIYNDWVQLLGYMAYNRLQEVKDFCAKNKGFFFQLERLENIGQASNIPNDTGDYSGADKRNKRPLHWIEPEQPILKKRIVESNDYWPGAFKALLIHD